MKFLLKTRASFFKILSACTMILFFACSLENAGTPTVKVEKPLEARTPNCNVDVSNQVKVKVSERDQIPLSQILTSTYYGTTTEGYCEYRLTTTFYGARIFYVTSIIGEEVEGL